MIDYINILISICISIFVYLLLDLIDYTNEYFDNLDCLPDNNYSYVENIKRIKVNLENDGYLTTDTYESQRLLQIYNIILCDLKNLNKNNLFEMKIISYLEIIINNENTMGTIDKIFSKIRDTTNKLILNISKISYDETNDKYLRINSLILENIKQEMLMKVL